jgi:hypothetical protein
LVNEKDLGAGVVFMIFGVFGFVLAGGYEIGSAGRMGPGYFPALISALLLVIGLVASARAFWSGRDTIEWDAPRPVILVLLAVIAFGVLLEPFGFAAATLVLVALAYFGAGAFRWVELLVLYGILLLGSFLIFAELLRIPVNMLPWL